MTRWTKVVGTAALAALLAAGCGKDDKAGKEKPKPATKPVEDKKPEPPKPLTTEQLVEKHKQTFAAFNANEMDKFGEAYADDATFEFVGGGPVVEGKANVLEAIGAYKTAFPDMKGDTRLLIANGKQIASLDVMTGTNTGELMGMPPTEKTAGIPAIHVFDFNDQGKVVKELVYYDPGTMMAQLGAAEMPHREAMEHTGDPAEVAVATDSETEQANMAMMKQADEAMAANDVDKAMAFLAEDIVIHDYTMPEDIEGTDKMKEMHEMWTKAFPDAKFESEWAFAAGDYVARGGTVTGTNKGPLPAMGVKKATGKTVTFSFAEIVKVEDGKVVESWTTGNTMPVAIALGLMPDPAAAEAPEGDKAAK